MMVLLGFNMKTFIEWGNGVGGIVFGEDQIKIWWGGGESTGGNISSCRF